jgi:hypothetical protein
MITFGGNRNPAKGGPRNCHGSGTVRHQPSLHDHALGQCNRPDENGEGSRLVPLDAQMAAEFEDRGTSFVVRSTVDELKQDLDPSYDWRRFEQQLGRDAERDRDHGHER